MSPIWLHAQEQLADVSTPGKDPDEIAGVTDGFWYRADVGILEGIDPDDPCEGGDLVYRWVDQLNSNHGDQTTEGNRPIYQDDPYVDFDGADNYLNAGAMGDGPASNDVIIVSTIYLDDLGAHNKILDKQAGAAGQVLFGVNSFGRLNLFALDNLANSKNMDHVGDDIVAGSWYVLAGMIDRQNDFLRGYINSTVAVESLDCSNVTGSLGNTGNAVLCMDGSGWGWTDGKIKEICCLWGALEEADVQDVVLRFKSRWGI